MIYCRNCGKLLNAHDPNCYNCSAPQNREQPEMSEVTVERKLFGKEGLIALVIAVVVVAYRQRKKLIRQVLILRKSLDNLIEEARNEIRVS